MHADGQAEQHCLTSTAMDREDCESPAGQPFWIAEQHARKHFLLLWVAPERAGTVEARQVAAAFANGRPPIGRVTNRWQSHQSLGRHVQVPCMHYTAFNMCLPNQRPTSFRASCKICLGDKVKQIVLTLGDCVLRCSSHKPRSVHSARGQGQFAAVMLLPQMFYNDKIEHSTLTVSTQQGSILQSWALRHVNLGASENKAMLSSMCGCMEHVNDVHMPTIRVRA